MKQVKVLKCLTYKSLYNSRGFHGSEDSSRGLLCCDAVYCLGRIQMFRRSVLPPSSGGSEDGGSMDLRNVGALSQHYTASQSRKPKLV
jgi:hypothetical protein